MSSLFYAVSTFIVSAATSLCSFFVLKVICAENIKKKTGIFFCVCMTLITWLLLLTNYDKNEVARAIIIFACLFALIYKITGKLIKTLFPYITILAVIAATDSLSVLGFYIFQYSEEVKLLVTSVIMAAITLVALPVKNAVSVLFENIKEKRSTRVLMVLTMLSILGATYLQVNYELALIGRRVLTDSIIGLFLTTLGVTYMNVIIAASGFIRSLKEEHEKKIITEQQRILEEMYDSTRVFRHNYRSTLIVLEGYCRSKDYEMLEKRISELKSDADDIYGSRQLKNAMSICDAGLRNLIMLKIFEARKNGVETSINISGQSFESFESMKMLNVLGALLDNAIEAASLSKKGIMHLELIHNEQNDSILIENSFGEKPRLDKILQKGYSTKNQSGLGLYYVNKVVSRDNNTDIVINCSDEMFSVRLLSVGRKKKRYAQPENTAEIIKN